jgi:hypothetical protein
MPKSPTQRSLDELRKRGATAQVVERWIPQTKIRKDLFGIIDIVAICEGSILGIQATSTTNLSARVAKSLAEPKLLEWLEANGEYEVWGWSKKGPKGKKKTGQSTVRRFRAHDGKIWEVRADEHTR